MRLCVFEDDKVRLLSPLTLTRAAFDLRCGARTLLERQIAVGSTRKIGQAENLPVDLERGSAGALVRPALADLCRLAHPELVVNDRQWLGDGPTIFINARWLPPNKTIDNGQTPHVGTVDGQVAYVIPPDGDSRFEDLDEWLDTCTDALPAVPVGGSMINYPWDLVEQNAEAIRGDLEWFAASIDHENRSDPWVLPEAIGPRDAIVVHPDAKIEPFVLADTRTGPVLIAAGAVVQSFSRLEGPCYIGPESWVLGGKLRGVALGPGCRVGGELEATIIQGFTNKYHDGFLGHSYLGEWVNLGAGTQVSDLRNDYGEIKVMVDGDRVHTGLTKVGVFMGDHTKSGLGTILNSGTSIGAFTNLLPSGWYLPATVPSFCTVRQGQIQERPDLRQIFNTAATVMRRRAVELTGTHIDYFFTLYDETASYRDKVIRDNERRRWRKSV